MSIDRQKSAQRSIWLSPYLLAVALTPAFVQIDYSGCAYYGDSRLTEFELIVDGENRITDFDLNKRSYEASLPAGTSEARVVTVTRDPRARVSIFVLSEGEGETYLDVGIGGSDFVVSIPPGTDTLQVWVAPSGRATDYYEVSLDEALPPLGGSGLTTWRAIPRVSQAGTCTYDSVNTVCTGCQDQAPVLLQPGGGQCAQFGTQVFGGCELPGDVLNAQLALDTTVTIGISSDSAGNVTTDVTVILVNPQLSTLAGLVAVDAATVSTSVTSGAPALLVNSLNPVFVGEILGAFTFGSNELRLDSDPSSVPGVGSGSPQDGIEMPAVTTAVTVTSDPVVFDYDSFSLTLTVLASGTPLVTGDANCDFNFPGAPVSVPQAP